MFLQEGKVLAMHTPPAFYLASYLVNLPRESLRIFNARIDFFR